MLKSCRYCNEVKDITEFPFFSTSTAGRKNTCKCCTQKLKKVRAELKLQYPPPEPGLCPICHQFTDVWILDHCHFTDAFRGYICNSCNLGIGRFNDDIELLERAITYLKK
jgi:hypothetical protein